MGALGARLTGLILALALGDFLFVRAHSAWTDYWLIKDAQKATALVTNEHWSGHNSVDYEYTVGQKRYTGHSARNPKDAKPIQPGEKTTVYFSASHPSLSLLYLPDTILEGLPVILIVIVFEAFAVITILNPKSGWAFSLLDKDPGENKSPTA
jgi:hypothetical protein